MTVKSIGDMSSDEKFAARLELEWDLDSDLRQQFTTFETFVAARHAERMTHVRFLRQRGMTEEERRIYALEWQGCSQLQEEFTDVQNYIGFRFAEERSLIGTAGR